MSAPLRWPPRALFAALLMLVGCLAMQPQRARAQDDTTAPVLDLGPLIEGLIDGQGGDPGQRRAPAPRPNSQDERQTERSSRVNAERIEPRAQADSRDGARAQRGEGGEDSTQDRGLLARFAFTGSISSLVTREEGSRVRLAGERSRARFTVDLPRSGAASTLVLTYRNSINVLPQDSELIVFVNGEEATTLPTNAFDAFRTTRIDALNLSAGTNVVTVQAVQRHRIFCGVAASFQIWTEIDTARSGVPLGPDRVGGDMDLATAFAGLPERAPLAVRAAPKADPAVVEALAERLAPAAGGLVRIGSVFDPITDRAGQPRVVVERGRTPSSDVVLGGDGATVLRIVHGPPGNTPESALPDLSALVGSDSAGAADDPRNPAVTPGRAITLDALGYEQSESLASFYREAVSFRIPINWLALSSQKAVLFLDYGFAEGLPEGARLLVKVNGTTVRLLPLDRGGGMQPTLDVGFLASLLGPGLNRLAFEVIVEAENPNLACPPWPQRLVTILPSSVLSIPDMPRMHFDGMELTLPSLAGSNVAFGQDERIGSGGLRPAEREELRALMAPAPRDYRLEAPENVSLTVLTIDQFGPAVTGDLAIDRSTVLSILAPAFKAPEPEKPDTLNRRLRDDRPGPLSETISRVRAAGVWARRLAIPGGPPLTSWLSGRNARAILLQPAEDAPDDLVLILSPTADPATVARAIMDDRLKRDGPHGRVALLSDDATWTSWRPPFDPPRLDETLTPWNVRAVLGNYASWLPLGFTGVLLALTLLSGSIGLMIVLKTREPNQR